MDLELCWGSLCISPKITPKNVWHLLMKLLSLLMISFVYMFYDVIYIYMCMCIYIIMCIYNYIYIIISYYFILRCFSLLFLRSGATVHLQHLPEVFAALATASSVLVALPHPGPQSAFEPQVTQVTGPSHTSKQITKPIPGSFRDHESWIMRHDSRWIMRKCTQII